MFQSYDNEVLCSVLFEQCNGDLDKSIETILEMQKVVAPEKTDKIEGAEADGQGKDEEGSSLADDGSGGNKSTETTGTSGKTEGSAGEAPDKATQELIDEMLAEEQQAILNNE